MSEESRVDPARAAFEQFKSLPREETLDMLNLVRFREEAVYPHDHLERGKRLTGAEAYRRYSKESVPTFRRVGGGIIWYAMPRLVLIGPGDERWDVAFVAHYSSASSFLGMITDED